MNETNTATTTPAQPAAPAAQAPVTAAQPAPVAPAPAPAPLTIEEQLAEATKALAETKANAALRKQYNEGVKDTLLWVGIAAIAIGGIATAVYFDRKNAAE